MLSTPRGRHHSQPHFRGVRHGELSVSSHTRPHEITMGTQISTCPLSNSRQKAKWPRKLVLPYLVLIPTLLTKHSEVCSQRLPGHSHSTRVLFGYPSGSGSWPWCQTPTCVHFVKSQPDDGSSGLCAHAPHKQDHPEKLAVDATLSNTWGHLKRSIKDLGNCRRQ